MLATRHEPYQLSFREMGADVVAFAAVEEAREKAARKGVTLHHSLEFGLDVWCDQVLLKEAISRLLDNAIEHSPAGNPIRVEAHSTEGEVVITVRDWGCGIEEEHMANIFEPFYVVRHGSGSGHDGTGLGLAIVRQIVQAHHAHISVESTHGHGSMFAVHLPQCVR